MQGVFHRALNMNNLLVEPQPSGPAVLKVSDFAYSKNALLDSRPKTMFGDLTYTCPELLMGIRQEDGTDTGRSGVGCPSQARCCFSDPCSFMSVLCLHAPQ